MQSITWHGSKACSPEGYWLECVKYKQPLDFKKISNALGVSAWRIEEPNQLVDVFPEVLRTPGPRVIDVIVDPNIPVPLGTRARAKAIVGFESNED